MTKPVVAHAEDCLNDGDWTVWKGPDEKDGSNSAQGKFDPLTLCDQTSRTMYQIPKSRRIEPRGKPVILPLPAYKPDPIAGPELTTNARVAVSTSAQVEPRGNPVNLPLPGYAHCTDPVKVMPRQDSFVNTAIVKLGCGQGNRLENSVEWDGDAAFSEKKNSGDENSRAIKRPAISGSHNWKYNKFSSYDQLRINFEKEGATGQKFLASVHGLYYQEENNKNWNTYLGETYYKFRARSFDFKFGLLTETLGSGDKVSFVDKVNSRRYQSGLANDYNRDKKEVPAFKTTYYINKRMSWDFHYLPVFQASELPDINSRWATSFQQNLGYNVLRGAKLTQEDDQSINAQYHVAFNSTFKKYELRYHYFWFKERLPVVEQYKEGFYKLSYPTDQTFAIDGNVTLGKDFLMRFELACSTDRTFSSYENGRIGPKFYSDVYNLLLGNDRTYRNGLYLNVQTFISYIRNFEHKTPMQLNSAEMSGSISVKKGFRNETIFLELNGVQNFTTGEFMLTPNVQMRRRDSLKLTLGLHVNGKSTDSLGPIGQFDKNNTPFFETSAIF
ncbi:MAG: hypothetical protein HQM09_12540 [Candidatus Riflebacteria bacterium]|nr:hypothetical protein [Candidatus Riflebacteria bacterium]